MYTGSLYGGLSSLVANVHSEELAGKRIAMFAYGAGCASTLFVILVKGSTMDIAEKMKLKERLKAMKVTPCAEYVRALKVRCRSICPLVSQSD